MFAIIEIGGKQHKVSKGTKLRVEKMELEAGKTVNLDKVLMVSDGSKLDIGMPYLKGASVEVSVKEHGKNPKVHTFKMKAKKTLQENNWTSSAIHRT